MARFFRRLCRQYCRKIRLTDCIEAALLLVACVLAWFAPEDLSGWTGTLLTMYIVLVIVKVGWTFKERGAQDRLQAETLWGLCDLLNAEVFGEENKTRFTLFQQDPLHAGRIVPSYRYIRGGRDAIWEANQSHSEYRRGEGATGQAWEGASETAIFFCEFPDFHDREAFEAFYTGELKIPHDVATRISDFMMDTRSVFSIGYTDARGKFLGVLSIDLQMRCELRKPDGDSGEHDVMVFKNNDGDEVQIRSEHLFHMARTICNVLCSFQQT